MNNYNYNTIKEIYGHNYKDDQYMSNKDIENLYRYGSDIYDNSIYCPDKLISNYGHHAFTSYTSTVSNSISDKPKMSGNVFSIFNSYYKLMSAKDIDWDNAYLKYLSIQNDYEKPITYQEIDMNTGALSETIQYNSDYIFKNGLSESSYTINHTYQLLNVIDYLFAKYNSLKFEMEMLKKQIEDKENYKNNQN